jgi:hypothetical protein
MDEVAHQLVLAFGLLRDQGKQLSCLFQVNRIQVSYAGQQRKVSLVTGTFNLLHCALASYKSVLDLEGL